MKVKLLKDFQGRETRNLFIREGYVVDVEEEMAVLLVRNGWAEMVLDPEDFARLAVEAGEPVEPVELGELLDSVTPENVHEEIPVSPVKPKGKKRGGK
jgi:hypothetical protein